MNFFNKHSIIEYRYRLWRMSRTIWKKVCKFFKISINQSTKVISCVNESETLETLRSVRRNYSVKFSKSFDSAILTRPQLPTLLILKTEQLQNNEKNINVLMGCNDSLIPFVLSNSAPNLPKNLSADLSDLESVSDKLLKLYSSPKVTVRRTPEALGIINRNLESMNILYRIFKTPTSLEIVDSRCLDPYHFFTTPEHWHTSYVWHEGQKREFDITVKVDRKVKIEDSVVKKIEASTGAPSLPQGSKNELKKSMEYSHKLTREDSESNEFTIKVAPGTPTGRNVREIMYQYSTVYKMNIDLYRVISGLKEPRYFSGISYRPTNMVMLQQSYYYHGDNNPKNYQSGPHILDRGVG